MKVGGEFFLMAVNRGLAPISMFFAFSMFQRQLSPESFSTFLVLFSFAQWFLTFGYQWQKNIAVKYWSLGYLEFSIRQYVLTSLFLGIVFLLVSFLFVGDVYWGAAIFMVLCGGTYALGISVRMQGYIKMYAVLDAMTQVLRWFVAVLVVFVSSNLDDVFFGMSVFLFLVLARYYWKLSPKLLWRGSGQCYGSSYYKLALYMMVFDLSAAGLLYIDRVYSSDSDYILASSVGAQFVSVLLGAIVSVMYPRLSIQFQKSGADRTWWRRYFIYYASIPLALGLSWFFCRYFSVYILKLIDPEYSYGWSLVFYHSLSQVLHFFVAFMGVYFILKGRGFISMVVYLVSFLGVCLSYYAYGLGVEPFGLIFVKTIILSGACLILFLYMINCWYADVIKESS